MRYELREDMAAPGEWRGGIGSVREFVYLTDGGFSVEGDGHKYKPWGFDGGADGAPSALVQETAAGERIELPSKVPYRKAKAGDRLIAYGPSGGGYGSAARRARRKPCSTTCSTASSPPSWRARNMAS